MTDLQYKETKRALDSVQEEETHTIQELESKGYSCKVIAWCMLLVYKQHKESGFDAFIYKFHSCDYNEDSELWRVPTKCSLFVRCFALYDGIRQFEFSTNGKTTGVLSGSCYSEMLLPAIQEFKQLEEKYCE